MSGIYGQRYVTANAAERKFPFLPRSPMLPLLKHLGPVECEKQFLEDRVPQDAEDRVPQDAKVKR
jgi:hypothetical protein